MDMPLEALAQEHKKAQAYLLPTAVSAGTVRNGLQEAKSAAGPGEQ